MFALVSREPAKQRYASEMDTAEPMTLRALVAESGGRMVVSQARHFMNARIEPAVARRLSLAPQVVVVGRPNSDSLTERPART